MKIQEMSVGGTVSGAVATVPSSMGKVKKRAEEAVDPAQQAAIAIAKKKKKDVSEGAVKALGMDLKYMTDKEFIAKYNKTKAEMRASMKEVSEDKQRLDPSCWKGYRKQGTKMKGGTRVNNCVPNESVSEDGSDLKKKISKYEDLALAANRAGDDAKCKLYQRKIQSLKQKMSQGVAEGAPELLKAEMPLVRYIEKELAYNGYEKGTEEYKKMFDHALAYYRKFGNVDAIKKGVAEGADDIAQAKERLAYLQKVFDPSYEYSDDHSEWKKNHAIEQEIRKLKKMIGQDEQGVAEAEGVWDTIKDKISNIGYSSPEEYGKALVASTKNTEPTTKATAQPYGTKTISGKTDQSTRLSAKESSILRGMIEARVTEDELLLVPGQGIRFKPDLMPKKSDHEIEMAKTQLLRTAQDAEKIFHCIKDVSEIQGLDAWVQAKITKASDYLQSVAQYLEGKMVEREIAVDEYQIRETEKLSAREKFKHGLKRAGYDPDAGAKRLLDLLARQKAEREEFQQKHSGAYGEKDRKVDEEDQQQDQPQQQEPKQGMDIGKGLGIASTIGRALNTITSPNFGSDVKSDIRTMIRNKITGEPNK